MHPARALILTFCLFPCLASHAQEPGGLQPRLLTDALTAIERNSAVRPDYRRLLAAAVRGIAKAMPPGKFKPAASGEGLEVDTDVPKTAGLIMRRPQNSPELRREIMEALAFANKLAPAVPLQELEEALLGDLVAEIDPSSAFLKGDAYRELSTGAGLGAELAIEKGTAKIIAPFEGSSAERAGLRPGDTLLKIDGTELKAKTADEIARMTRGAPESRVQLDILRGGQKEPLHVEVVREAQRAPSVASKVIEPGFAWVRLPQIQEQTYAAFVAQVNAFYGEAPLKGVVLDLRNTPGAVPSSSVAVAAAFLPRGTPVLTLGTRGFRRGNFGGAGGTREQVINEALKTVPVVVLVNGGTASAAELLAGALQDHKRAVVLGSRTFGKGSVQALFPLQGGEAALRLTVAQFQTPKGTAIEGKGITPDVQGEDTDNARPPSTYGGADDADLRRAVGMLKSL